MNALKFPPYSEFPFISNDKLSLREIQNSDIKAIVEISFYNSIQAKNVEEATEMNSKINSDYMNGNSIHWAIVDNITDRIVGTCGYYRGFERAEGELGCVLLARYRGQGFMTAALLLAIDFGRKTIGLRRILAITNLQNDKAIQLLERLDFKKVKILDNNEIELELVKFKYCCDFIDFDVERERKHDNLIKNMAYLINPEQDQN